MRPAVSFRSVTAPVFCGFVNSLGNRSGVQSVDLSGGQVITITATGDVSFNFTRGQPGAVYSLLLGQDSAGSHVWSFTTTVKMPGGSLNFSSVASATDLIELLFDGSRFYVKTTQYNQF